MYFILFFSGLADGIIEVTLNHTMMNSKDTDLPGIFGAYRLVKCISASLILFLKFSFYTNLMISNVTLFIAFVSYMIFHLTEETPMETTIDVLDDELDILIDSQSSKASSNN